MFLQKIGEKVLQKCNHGYKNVACLTNPKMTLEGLRLCLEYPSSLFVCLFVCLSVCPPVFSETARYTLTKLCVQVTYVVRQKRIDFGAN